MTSWPQTRAQNNSALQEDSPGYREERNACASEWLKGMGEITVNILYIELKTALLLFINYCSDFARRAGWMTTLQDQCSLKAASFSPSDPWLLLATETMWCYPCRRKSRALWPGAVVISWLLLLSYSCIQTACRGALRITFYCTLVKLPRHSHFPAD